MGMYGFSYCDREFSKPRKPPMCQQIKLPMVILLNFILSLFPESFTREVNGKTRTVSLHLSQYTVFSGVFMFSRTYILKTIHYYLLFGTQHAGYVLYRGPKIKEIVTRRYRTTLLYKN